MKNIDRLIKAFQLAYPDLHSFEDFGDGYSAGEDSYKREASARMHTVLGGWVEGTEPDLSPSEFVQRLRTVLEGKLEKAGFAPNLTNWRDHEQLFKKLLTNDRDTTRFADLLREVLHDSADDFDPALEQLLDWLEKKKFPANVTKSIPTLLLFYWDPAHHIFIKPDVFDRFLRAVGEKHLGRGKRLSVAEYRRLLEIMSRLSLELAPFRPRDMVDLQSFVFTVSYDAKRLEAALKTEPAEPSPKQSTQRPIEHNMTDEQTDRVFRALQRTKQVILTGPPGTGKTRLATQLMYKLWEENHKDALDTLWDDFHKTAGKFALAIALGMERMALPAAPIEIARNPVVTQWLRRQTSLAKENRDHRVRDELQHYTSPRSKTVNIASKRRKPYVFDNKGDARWYLADPGKIDEFHNASKARDILNEIDKLENIRSNVTVVNFHPSMNYEDFVEGLRPALTEPSAQPTGTPTSAVAHGAAPPTNGGTAGSVQYRLVDGPFRTAVESAFGDPDNLHLLIIDEINRGNLSRIFGELISVLEGSKRARRVAPGAQGDVPPQLRLPSGMTKLDSAADAWQLDPRSIPVRLAYSGRPMVVPENLLVLGTMNTAHRSIALMDFALRRRFHFTYCAPDMTVVKKVAKQRGGDELAKQFEQPIQLFDELNNRVEYLKDREHKIGHSYLIEAVASCAAHESTSVEDAVGEILQNQVIPLLWEYFYSDWPSLKLLLGNKIVKRVETQYDQDEDEYDEVRRKLVAEAMKPDAVYRAVSRHLKVGTGVEGTEGQGDSTTPPPGDQRGIHLAPRRRRDRPHAGRKRVLETAPAEHRGGPVPRLDWRGQRAPTSVARQTAACGDAAPQRAAPPHWDQQIKSTPRRPASRIRRVRGRVRRSVPKMDGAGHEGPCPH